MDDSLIFAYLAKPKLFIWKAKWHIVLVDLQNKYTQSLHVKAATPWTGGDFSHLRSASQMYSYTDSLKRHLKITKSLNLRNVTKNSDDLKMNNLSLFKQMFCISIWKKFQLPGLHRRTYSSLTQCHLSNCSNLSAKFSKVGVQPERLFISCPLWPWKPSSQRVHFSSFDCV